MGILINLANGWIVNTDEIRYVRPIKNSEQGNKSTILLVDGEKVHTVLSADEIDSRINDAMLRLKQCHTTELLKEIEP